MANFVKSFAEIEIHHIDTPSLVNPTSNLLIRAINESSGLPSPDSTIHLPFALHGTKEGKGSKSKEGDKEVGRGVNLYESLCLSVRPFFKVVFIRFLAIQ